MIPNFKYINCNLVLIFLIQLFGLFSFRDLMDNEKCLYLKKKKKKIQPTAIFPCVPASSLIGDLLQPSLVDKRHLKTKSLK